MMKTYEYWLPLANFEEVFLDTYSKSKRQRHFMKGALKEIISELHLKYPSPKSYLQAIKANPDEALFQRFDRTTHSYTNEIQYILAWIYLHQVCADGDDKSMERRNILIDFLNHKMPRRHFEWAFHFNLLTTEEANFFWKLSRSSGLTLHLLMAAKPLCCFSDDDVRDSSLFNVSSSYNPKILGEFLYLNGYSDKLFSNSMSGRKKNLHELLSHPIVGKIVLEYERYMTVQNCSRQTISVALRGIKSLASYLELHSHSDCSKFNDYELKKLVNFVCKDGVSKKSISEATAAAYLYEIDLFFRWGTGRYSFFPDVYISIQDEIVRLSKIARNKYAVSEGLAFNNEETAEKVAKAILNYRPKDDVEKLCRYYWMICMSTVQRQTWFLQLEAGNCLASLPLDSKAMGLYSKDADKAGHIYGQFPILHNMGIKAVKALERRAKNLNLPPIANPKNGKKYVHLFQLESWPWILPNHRINSFIKMIKELYDIKDGDGKLAKGSSHSFRTHLLGEIISRTGSIDAAILAAGHRDDRQIKAYLKSNLAQKSLARAFIGKYEAGDITGPFFIKIMEILSSQKPSSEEVFNILTSEMPLNEYMKKYGVQTKFGIGTCMNQQGCPQGVCWECPYFLMSKNDLNKAMDLLLGYFSDICKLTKQIKDFSKTNLSNILLKSIVLVSKHLINLGLSQDNLVAEVNRFFSEEYKNNES